MHSNISQDKLHILQKECNYKSSADVAKRGQNCIIEYINKIIVFLSEMLA